MATLEQLKQALYNADQAGDFEAASTLAAAIQNMQSTVQGPPNRPGEVTPPKKEYTLGEQIIGGLEADAALFTGMTSGAVGYISGVIEGLGDQALKGQWKPEEILQTAEKGAAKFTYEPKTEAGKEITQRVGGMLTAADFMGPSPTGMFGDIIHPELTPAAAMAKGEQVIQKTAPIVKKAVPLVEKTIEKTTGIFKKELPKTQEEVTSVIQKASRGDKKAQQIIKEIAPFDKEAFDASQRLGIDLPISEFIKNDETAKTVGLSRSQVGSHEEAMFKQDVINTAKIADETIQALGNATDLATISEQVKNDLTRARQSLKDQERVLYTKVDESVPKDTYVNAPTLNDILTQTAKELGGEERLTASEKNLLALSRSETLTYGALLRVKNDIGGSLGKTSMFPDINEAQLGKIYNAIKEDQRLAVSDFAGENALADLQLANTLTVKRKALEDNIVSGFGRKGTGSISRLIENAIKSGSKGDVTNLNKLLSIVPIDMQRDVIATALKDLSTSKKAGNLGEFDFTNYAKTYEGLRQNAPIYNTVIKTIGEDKAQILQDLYSVSRTINEAKGNVLHTGKANQAILQTLKGNTIMQNIVGKIIGWGTQKLTAGLVSPDFLFKTPQDKLQAIADLMRNPDFKQMIVEAAKGKVNPETMAKVVKTDAYKAAAKDVRVEETPPQTVKQKVEAKRAEKAKPTKDEVKKKVEEKKAEKKPIDAKEEARKEIKNNEYLDAYKELILESGKATTKAERNKSHGWFDVTVKDDFGQDVATQRVAGQRDITEAFTADKASIDRFMKGKATVEDLKAIKHDLNTFELNSDLRDEASILRANKSNESVELSDGSIYDPFSKMTYSKKEWQDLMDEAMFSKSPAEQSRLEEWHKDSAPETKNADGTPKVFYHGTGADFSEFKNGVINWTTPDINLAEEYSYIQRANGRTDIRKSGQSVMPVFVKVKNPLEIRSPLITRTAKDFIYEVMNSDDVLPILRKMPKEELDALLKDIEKLDDTRNVELYNLWDNNTELIGIFKKFGFDSIKTQESGSTTIGVFNPNQIKSVFNKGTYSESNPNILMSKGADNKDLIVQHNLSEKNLEYSKKTNGIIVPSLGITKKDTPLTGFGEITLLGDKELANPKGYAKTKVFGADIYSPRFPKEKKEYKLSDIRKIDKELEEYTKKIKEGSIYDDESIANIYDNKAMQMKFLEEEKGIKFDIPMKKTQYSDMERPDTYALRDKLRPEIEKYADEYQSYVNNFLNNYEHKSFFYKDGKKIKFNADSIIKHLTSNLRGGENWNYGTGSLRAKVTPEFKSIEEIRKNKDKIVSQKDFESVKEEITNELFDIAEKLKPHYKYKTNSFGYTDEVINALGGKNTFSSLSSYGFTNISPEVKLQITNFMDKLKNMPTEYFEAKITRTVQPSEFHTAVVPDTIKPETIKYLEEQGLNIKKYKKGDEADRARAIKEAAEENDLLFSQFKAKNATTKQEAQTIAQNLLGKHYAKHADTFEIVQSVEDLPQNIKDALYSVEAYHGTPHNVDRFSTKYIGTGEGAQAYGYGMYFADSKKVAEWYRDNLQGLKNEYKPKGYDTGEWWNQAKELYPSNKAKQEAWHILAQGDFSKDKNKLIEWGKENAYSEASKKEIENVANQIYGEGNLYKVELKPKKEEYLLWDKPLSEQSDYVKQALEQKFSLPSFNEDYATAGDFYRGRERKYGNAEKASQELHSLGIKGIKYLDNTSRGKGEGNHNYVIFKDEDVGVPEILKSGGKARGIFDPKSGKAYIIADAMKANEVEGVILHELLHKNINNEVKAGKSRAEAIMGSRYESVVKRLDNLYKMGDKQVKDAFQKVTDANTPAQHRIEEVMTYLLENITNESKPLLIKWKDDVIAAIKAFIAKTALQLGMKAETVMNKLNSNDIANILRSEAIKNESMLKNIKR